MAGALAPRRVADGLGIPGHTQVLWAVTLQHTTSGSGLRLAIREPPERLRGDGRPQQTPRVQKWAEKERTHPVILNALGIFAGLIKNISIAGLRLGCTGPGAAQGDRIFTVLPLYTF